MPSRSGRREKRDDQQPASGSRSPAPDPSSPAGDHVEHDVPVPRDFGRDGISGLLTPNRALRAREVSRPRPEDEAEAQAGADAMLRRLGRRSR
ncbi:hypothetical protein GA0111570_10667 [Raineyella antarctica]|uniref:Uncharacterized protein n=1 Tax=Raineyella antarctica TaxID=1577474 RepID=A0A1G6H363_9ACTN|nr:hypothetical protein [Raineyella antarctica]SDB88335.1 hypothetical protein GA0111570_10667 [Raineyella antarctica]